MSSKIVGILWEVLSLSNVQLHKTLCLKLYYRNAPMIYNWCNLFLCLAASSKKYFRVLINPIGAQVSPILSLFCKSPLTSTFQDFHQILSLPFRHPWILLLDLPSPGHPLQRSYCWLNVWYLWKFLSTKPSWNILVIL